MSATYLLKARTSGEGSQVGYAVVTITPELAETIVACHEAWKALGESLKGKINTYEAAFWNSAPEFAEYDEWLRERLDGNDYVKLSSRFKLREELYVSGECYRLVVNDGYFHWEAYEKHTDTVIETSELEIEIARKVLAKAKKKAAA